MLVCASYLACLGLEFSLSRIALKVGSSMTLQVGSEAVYTTPNVSESVTL